MQILPPKFDRSALYHRLEYADTPPGSNFATGPSNAGPSNMGPLPIVPVRTSPQSGSGAAPQLWPQVQQSPWQIESCPH